MEIYDCDISRMNVTNKPIGEDIYSKQYSGIYLSAFYTTVIKYFQEEKNNSGKYPVDNV